MILHTINKNDVIDECLAHVAQGDIVVLIENAVNNEAIETLRNHLKNNVAIDIYLLDDTKSIAIKQVNAPTAIDYKKFVDLSVKAEKVVSWY